MNAKLKILIERVETWPEAVQEEAIASLEAIEEELLQDPRVSPEDIEALRQSAEDVWLGRFASKSDTAQLLTAAGAHENSLHHNRVRPSERRGTADFVAAELRGDRQHGGR